MAGVAQAYDNLAPHYDEFVWVDGWMRHFLWRRYLACFPPGSHILDVACGTGLDALFLVGQGRRVTGIDISPAMIAQLRNKAQEAGIADSLDTHVLAVAALSTLPAQAFDGVVSAFAGLNTGTDLPAFARDAARLLRPGGRMLIHMLNRFSVWEWLGLVARRRWKKARRLGKARQRPFIVGGEAVTHRLFFPDEARASFEPYFSLQRSYSLGAILPPANIPVPSMITPLLKRLDPHLGALLPFRNWGRFFVLELRKREP